MESSKSDAPARVSEPPAVTWSRRDQALAWATKILDDAGVDQPRRDAEVLLGAAAGLTRTQILAFADEPIPAGREEAFRAAIARRATLEPVAYITEMREFWSLPFKVTPAVLIPRPETEALVEACLAVLPDTPRILDVGTGSGAIVGALGHERADAALFAIDLSPDALAIARENLKRLGLTVTCLEGDLFAPLARDASLDPAISRFDLIVSNPPYIGLDEADGLMSDVRDYEPDLALYGGEIGLDIIERLIVEAPRWLRPGGWLAFEFAVRQADAVDHRLADSAFGFHRIGRDWSGDPRFAMARLTSTDGTAT